MKKRFLIPLLLLLAGAAVLLTVKITPAAEYRAVSEETPENGDPCVLISVNCAAALDNPELLDDNLRNGSFLPADGVILEPTHIKLEDGDSVFDVLMKAARPRGIPVEYQGADVGVFGSVYIEGIGLLYEFSCGQNSGWIYKVNGETPRVGCSEYTLSDGDIIEWIYTVEQTEW